MSFVNKDMRDAYFDELYNLGSQDKNVIVLSNDMEVWSLIRFRKDFPQQFINTGVSEQNMINVAAGLASADKKVYVYGISSFVTFRCFEQIKLSICSMNLPVIIIGIGSGMSFSFDGPSHHGMQDVAVMRTLPEITIFNPCDSVSAAACFQFSDSPTYVRIDKGVFPVFHAQGEEMAWKEIKKGSSDTCILATGFMTNVAMNASSKISKDISVIDVGRLKPLHEDLVHKIGQFNHIYTLEENSIVGGLGTMIAEVIVDNGFSTTLTRLALADVQYLQYGHRQWFHKAARIDANSVVDIVSRGS